MYQYWMFPLIARTRQECLHTTDVRQGNQAKKKKKEERGEEEEDEKEEENKNK